MTEYEMLYLSQVYVQTGAMCIMNFFTAFAAYAVAGYLAAHHLSRRMAAFVTAAFVAFSVLLIAMFFNTGRAVSRLIGDMHMLALSGKGGEVLRLYVNITGERVWVLGGIALLLMLGVMVGAIMFFYECRRRNSAGEVKASQPAVTAPGA